MQAVLCDTCHRPLDGRTVEMHLFFGEAFATQDGRARVAHRGTSKVLHLCNECGSWVDDALRHLRESHDRRATPRFAIAIDVMGQVRGSTGPAATFRGRTINLSRGGTAIDTNADVPAGTEVALRFCPDDRQAAFDLVAVALSPSSTAPDGTRSPLRVRFLEADPRSIERLEGLLAEVREGP